MSRDSIVDGDGCVRVTDVRVIDIIRSQLPKSQKKVLGWTSGAQRTAQRKDFELILTVKIEIRNPVGGPFVCEFSAFVIIAELSRPEVARPGNF